MKEKCVCPIPWKWVIVICAFTPFMLIKLIPYQKPYAVNVGNVDIQVSNKISDENVSVVDDVENRIVEENSLCDRSLLNATFVESVGQEAFDKALEYTNKLLDPCDKQRQMMSDLISVTDVFLYDKNGKLNETLFDAFKKSNIKHTSNETEYFRFKLNASHIKSIYNNMSFDCNLTRFDKKYGESELQFGMDVFEFYTLNDSNDYSVYLNSSGFYNISCFNKSVYFYRDVVVVWPYRMTRLMDERKKYKIDEFHAFGRANMTKHLHKKRNVSNPMRNKRKKMNILILGFESTSYLNFHRSYPLTYKFLMNRSVFYSDLNSVGSNTFPNIVPFLTGITVVEQRELQLKSEVYTYLKKDGHFFDRLPFIWNEYEDDGYVTMYQEDSPTHAVFNYRKNGFRGTPTGFYGRAFWMKYYGIQNGPHLCHNGKHMYNTYFDLIENFVNRMSSIDENKNLPYFSFNFLTDYTHNTLAAPPKMDARLNNMLETFEKNGYFDDTLLVLFGDHGSRLSKFAIETEVGKAEKYRPFLSIILPKPMLNTQFATNARQNKNRLMSMFDLHQTMKHFVKLNRGGYLHENEHSLHVKNERELRGISLFEQIPINRSCFDALVPAAMCSCGVEQVISIDEFKNSTNINFNEISNIFLSEIIKLTSRHRNVCTIYVFDKMNSIKLKPIDSKKFYFFEFILQPGNAIFNVIVEIEKSKEGKIEYQFYGNIIRTSIYGNTSHCVEDSDLKNYCFCKSLLTTTVKHNVLK